MTGVGRRPSWHFTMKNPTRFHGRFGSKAVLGSTEFRVCFVREVVVEH